MKSGRVLLSETLIQVRKSLQDGASPLVQQQQSNKLERSYIRNLAVLSAGFFLLFTAFFAVRNMQSSINTEGNLGLISLACVYGSFVVGCLLSVCIIRQKNPTENRKSKIRPKYAIIFASLGPLVYTAMNFYPRCYCLIPASVLLGISLSNLWTAQGTYITSLAVTYAAVTCKAPERAVGLFNTVFLFVLQMSHVVGNLIASTVFLIDPPAWLKSDNVSNVIYQEEVPNASLVEDYPLVLNSNVCVLSNWTMLIVAGVEIERTTVLIAILTALSVAGKY